MQSNNARTPLLLAGAAALLTYLLAGHVSVFDIGRLASRHHKSVVFDDRMVTQQRQLPDFDGIVLRNGANITIAVSEGAAVELAADQGAIDRIVTRVEDGKLIVEDKRAIHTWSFGRQGPVPRLTLTVPHLKSLRVDGFGAVSLTGLRDPIAITVNGPSTLHATGNVDSVDLTVNGPSDLRLAELRTKDLSIHLNGIGNVEVFATDNLTATVQGIGHVRYLGDPHLVQSIHGIGSIERMTGPKES